MSQMTYQDFMSAGDGGRIAMIAKAITDYKASEDYQTALTANLYDHHKNVTINSVVPTIYDILRRPEAVRNENGEVMQDENGNTIYRQCGTSKRPNTTASNLKIASNYFHRLNVDRCAYSLGNGLIFEDAEVKKKLGADADDKVYRAAFLGLINAVSYLFLDVDHIVVFPMTQFVPLWDEDTGALRAGIRFLQTADDKPLFVTLYEVEGVTEYKSKDGTPNNLKLEKARRAYKTTYARTEANPEGWIVGESNYNGFPIVPLWGSSLHQSTLVGIQQTIDAIDLIQSGLANTINDCPQIYWIAENYGGMEDDELDLFRQRILQNHIAQADTSNGGKITPYTQEVPHEASRAGIQELRNRLYEDFGALDVHTIAAGATNDHVDAAYQPMDEEADDFEYQIIQTVRQLLSLVGVDASPEFKRNKISNRKEQVEMVMMMASELDRRSILKLSNIIPDDMIEQILEAKDREYESRLPPIDFIEEKAE